MTNDQQPMSYTDKLYKYLEDKDTNFTIDQLRNHLNGFKEEQDKLKEERADIMPTGKYRYKKVKDVAAFDKQYLEWMLKQSWVDKYPSFRTECAKYL